MQIVLVFLNVGSLSIVYSVHLILHTDENLLLCFSQMTKWKSNSFSHRLISHFTRHGIWSEQSVGTTMTHQCSHGHVWISSIH